MALPPGIPNTSSPGKFGFTSTLELLYSVSLGHDIQPVHQVHKTHLRGSFFYEYLRVHEVGS